MPRPTKYWVITDTHFNHDAIITSCNRPANADELIVKNCKSLCATQDWLIHLGDTIFYKYPDLTNILSQIPCRKILVMGNHDKKSKNWYMNNGFEFACDSFTWGNLFFTHKPLQQFPEGTDYNIHGHWHNCGVENNPPNFWSPLTHFKLAVEDTNYFPMCLDKIKAIMNTRNGR